MSGTRGEAAVTPGQALYVANANAWPDDDSVWLPWPSVDAEGRAIWEQLAQVAIAAQPQPGGREFRDRFTVIPDTGVTALNCFRCPGPPPGDTWEVGYHPSLDVLVEQARAHDAEKHGVQQPQPAPGPKVVTGTDWKGRTWSYVPPVAAEAEAPAIAQPQPAPALCPVAFVPADPDACSCTCDRAEGHLGKHRCPLCEASWYLASERWPESQPAPDPSGLRADLIDAMLRWSGRDRADTDECASELAAILDRHPMAQPAPGFVTCDHSPAELGVTVSGEPQPAPGDAGVTRLRAQLAGVRAVAEREASKQRQFASGAMVAVAVLAALGEQPEPQPAAELAAAMAETRTLRARFAGLAGALISEAASDDDAREHKADGISRLLLQQHADLRRNIAARINGALEGK